MKHSTRGAIGEKLRINVSWSLGAHESFNDVAFDPYAFSFSVGLEKETFAKWMGNSLKGTFSHLYKGA